MDSCSEMGCKLNCDVNFIVIQAKGFQAMFKTVSLCGFINICTHPIWIWGSGVFSNEVWSSFSGWQIEIIGNPYIGPIKSFMKGYRRGPNWEINTNRSSDICPWTICEANSSARKKLKENYELWRTDNVCGQISGLTLSQRKLLCLLSLKYFLSWGIFSHVILTSHVREKISDGL